MEGGTDTNAHNMLDEMRLLAYLTRTQAGNPRIMDSTNLFNAVTIGGSRAVGWEVSGWLAVGADLVRMDLAHPMMRPTHDPVRNLIHAAGNRAIRAVYIDGLPVVHGGKVLATDTPAAAAALPQTQARITQEVPNRDWGRRTGEAISPLTFRAV